MRAKLKSAVLHLLLAAVAPWVVVERAARWCCGHDVWFEPQAEWVSLVPGRLGVWSRAAFYHLSLAACPLDVAIQFGALVTHSETELGHRVYVGIRTLIGWACVGDDTMLADHVQLLSGAGHHLPAADTVASSVRQGRPTRLERLDIGCNCWIGAQAMVMAAIGDHCIVGAGSVVTRPILDGVTAVGNPARALAAVADSTARARGKKPQTPAACLAPPSPLNQRA